MKTLIIGIVLVIGLGAAGYFAVPFLIEQKTEGLRAEVKELRQRLENSELFIKGEVEARKNVRIESGADAATIRSTIFAGLGSGGDSCQGTGKKVVIWQEPV